MACQSLIKPSHLVTLTRDGSFRVRHLHCRCYVTHMTTETTRLVTSRELSVCGQVAAWMGATSIDNEGGLDYGIITLLGKGRPSSSFWLRANLRINQATDSSATSSRGFVCFASSDSSLFFHLSCRYCMWICQGLGHSILRFLYSWKRFICPYFSR